MPRDFVIVDVFTDRPFGGNQLAVLPDATGLDPAQMQALAREFNFAESTFVLPGAGGEGRPRVRIFTPAAELPFAGHPSVGTGAVLAHLGAAGGSGDPVTVVLDEQVGPVTVTVDTVGDGAYRAELSLDATLELPSEAPDRSAVAAAIGVDPAEVVEAWFAGVGVPFCFCRLADAATVDRARPDRAAWEAGLRQAWGPQVYLFAGEAVGGASLYARMFAPGLGIDEDPATGSAAVALAGSVAARDGRPDVTVMLTVDQGVALGRPSRLVAHGRCEAGRVAEVRVGGGVVVVGEGRLRVP